LDFSIAFHAFSLTLANARPGGIIVAFCDPPIIMSMPHSSGRRSVVPRPVMASTTKAASGNAAYDLPSA
jgi:hypothetical protein